MSAREQGRDQTLQGLLVAVVEGRPGCRVDVQHRPHPPGRVADRDHDLGTGAAVAGDVAGEGVDIGDDLGAPSAAAAPQTPAPKGMRRQPRVPW